MGMLKGAHEPREGATGSGWWNRARHIVTDRRAFRRTGLVLLAGLAAGTGLLGYRLYAARQELHAQALLGEALTRAETVLEALQEGKPEDVKPEALQQVLEALQQVRTEYPGSSAAGFSLLQVGHLQYRFARYAEAARTYQAYLAEYPRGPFVFWAAMGQGYSLEGQEEWEQAARIYEAAGERHAGIPFAAEALMGKARCYEALNRLPDARAVYAEIVETYPETVWGSLAERRMALLDAS